MAERAQRGHLILLKFELAKKLPPPLFFLGFVFVFVFGFGQNQVWSLSLSLSLASGLVASQRFPGDRALYGDSLQQAASSNRHQPDSVEIKARLASVVVQLRLVFSAANICGERVLSHLESNHLAWLYVWTIFQLSMVP